VIFLTKDIDKTIFKAYDIRGVYPVSVNENAAYLIGRAFVEFLGAKNVVVGRDMRESGESLYKELARGITDQGADLTYIGQVTTPMLNFAVASEGFDGGIIISASHSPKQYNAFKLIQKPVFQISSDTGMKEIEKLCLENDFKDPEKKGIIVEKNILQDYKTHILSLITHVKDIKIVVDYGNGIGAVSGIPVLDELDVEVINLYEKPDGNFPNHEANPVKFNTLVDIQKRIVDEKADVGLAFDGDADRCIILDQNGNYVTPDKMLGLLAMHELDKKPNQNVFHDLRFSKVIRNKIREHTGIPSMLKVGNPFYKHALVTKGGVVAGEFSGHIMFKENYCMDDGLFAGLKFIQMMKELDKDIPELMEIFNSINQTEEINLHVDNATETLAKIADKYSDGKSTEIDGVYIEYDDWWFSLRMSNTEPVVRLMVEADTKEMMEEKRDEILDLIGGERQK
jgi:phosphomannomutase